MGWVFGIDGGGTSSRLRVEGLEGGLLFYAEGGATNLNASSPEEVEAVLRGLFERAYAEAGLSPGDCAAGFAGTAGVDREEDRRPFAELVLRAGGLACPIGAGNDAEPALAGALSDTEGLLLIAGTGSIAYGRAHDGFSVRAGGWGHLLGDEGSAYRIAFEALCRGMRSAEGRDLPTGLLEAGLAFFGLGRPEDLVPFVYGSFDKTRIARFARLVGEARDCGDPLALELFDEAARELCLLLESVHGRIAGRLKRRRVAFRGGLIESDHALRAALIGLLAERLPDLAIVEDGSDAATGACILARELASNHG